MLKVSSSKVAFVLCAFCLVAAISSPAQTFTTLYSFCSQPNCTDGAEPVAPLIQGTDGKLYGTTIEYGANGSNGTVFKITTGGGLTTLYSFCSKTNCTDGAEPVGLVLATNGDFYGTTDVGGADYGTAFKISSNGALTTLYSFCTQTDCADGAYPVAGLVQATNGNFYGTTFYGGASATCNNGSYGCGTAFRISASGALTTLYSFCSQSGCTDGGFPEGAGLIQATNGDLYGTTPYGGSYPNCALGASIGCGTIFKITLDGTLTTLYGFCSGGYPCVDGAEPGAPGYGAGLVQGADGNFYGTTGFGGSCNYGTVFKVTPTGNLTTLHSFGTLADCEYGADGAYPNPGLILATDGNFYGTTSAGGTSTSCVVGQGCGTAFEITPAGALTTLYGFCSQTNCTDGYHPVAGLAQATNGSLYGTTDEGGANGLFYGTVFTLSVGLEPFVKTNPTSGAVGTKVTILGNNLKGSTSVTFNGTAATFTVNSTGTAITTTVPSGATTGHVQVTTASGTTLTSNVKFRVP